MEKTAFPVMQICHKCLYDNMGDTGLEPVTPCLSSKCKVFLTNFISARFSVCYVAITL